jgi:NAD(P)-dependent dehydrogenase (short-subunit alcohol dehydrogenase family)
MVELGGEVAAVTGGGGGLGTALASAFAGAGMDVALLDRDLGAAQTAAADLSDRCGVTVRGAFCDVGDAASVLAAAAWVGEVWGHCNVVCANVGVQQFGALDRLTDDDWEWVLRVNVLGTVRTVRAFLPLLRAAAGRRHVVLTASSSVLAPSVRLGAYQTSKFAVTGFGETLREEVRDEGIGVTILFPGGMTTRHLETSAAARPADLPETGAAADDLDAMLAHSALREGDLATPEHAVRNLLADLAANEPYSITHGTFRSTYESRRVALGAAFDRMEAS